MVSSNLSSFDAFDDSRLSSSWSLLRGLLQCPVDLHDLRAEGCSGSEEGQLLHRMMPADSEVEIVVACRPLLIGDKVDMFMERN